MTLVGRLVPAPVLAVALGAAMPSVGHAQLVVADTERLSFDRPESWGMKYYASLTLPSDVGAPRERGAGQIEVGFESADVPQLTAAKRRIGFNGTKLEEVNKTRFFGRIRSSVGLGRGFALELAYLPPIELGGARPNIFSLALDRSFPLAPGFRFGVRAFGQVGRIEADVTCSAREVAAGDDPQGNPFQCVSPSRDQSRQKLIGLELELGHAHASDSRFDPYLGLGLDYMDLSLHVDATYSRGLVEDHSVQLTNGTTLFATAGLSYQANPRLRVTAELFYSWLSVARPPSIDSANDGFLNARVLATFRLR